MSGDCPVFDLRWSLADHDGFSEERLSTVAGALARQAKGPPRPQAGGEFLTQGPTALDIKGLVDCIMADAHPRILGNRSGHRLSGKEVVSSVKSRRSSYHEK